MTRIQVFAFAFAVGVVSAALAEERLVDAPAPSAWIEWPSTPPADCPFERSKELVGIGFTHRHAEYTYADTWYPCWASDGNLYSPWTDGRANGMSCGSMGADKACTGHAKILGDDPLKLTIADVGKFRSSALPYKGRYPCGSLLHDGVWYYGTYCLARDGRQMHNGKVYNWPWMGPLVGFRWSLDYGKTWHETPCTPAKSLFGESGLDGGPVKIGAAFFVDFGKNMEHSPDGKAYLVAQGASDGKDRRFAYNSWITADQVYLLRVTPTVENINDPSKYEFFAGRDEKGDAVWTRDFAAIRPLLEWRDRMGRVAVTYNAPLRKYIMCVTDGRDTVSEMNTYILESDSLTGTWRLVTFMENFGEQAYFVNIPSKFVNAADGQSMWLCYAANFSQGNICKVVRSLPVGSRYAMNMREFRLLRPGEAAKISPLDSPRNIARIAKVTVSSVHRDYRACGVVDGVVDGYPGNMSHEWCTAGERDTAMIRLDWPEPQKIDRVQLFDRPNALDQVQGGMLIFSDGTSIRTGALPDVAKKGLEVTFTPKTVRWVIFTVDKAKKNSPNIGLSEIAVFSAS